MTHCITYIPVNDDEWMTQNSVHRLHYQAASRRAAAIREKAFYYAKRDLTPCKGPVAVFARVRVPSRKGKLPDADAIAPIVKHVIDGFVDAGIMPDDSGEYVYLVGYGRPERDKTLKTREIQIILTDQYVPF